MAQHNHTHSSSNIKVAFFLNFLFTIIEIIGGIYTNSIAIISDAIHDLGDSISLGFSWYMEKYSTKKGDRQFSYGYKRFSLVGALANGLILFMGSFFVIREAVIRLITPEPSDAKGMMAFAILGILVNGLAVLRVRGGVSLNEKMVSWHLLEDVLGWVAVLIVSIVLMFREIFILDAILSLLISAFVLFNVYRNLKTVFKVLLQGVPEELDINEIVNEINAIKNVVSSHHTHVWSFDGINHVLTAHVVVKDDAGRHDITCIKQELQNLKEKLGIYHTTIEIEHESEECEMEHMEH